MIHFVLQYNKKSSAPNYLVVNTSHGRIFDLPKGDTEVAT